MSQIRPGGHLLLGTCHMEMEMPLGFTKKSDRQLQQADYNRLQPVIHRMVKLSYIWPFLGLLIVHRTQGKIIVQIR